MGFGSHTANGGLDMSAKVTALKIIGVILWIIGAFQLIVGAIWFINGHDDLLGLQSTIFYGVMIITIGLICRYKWRQYERQGP